MDLLKKIRENKSYLKKGNEWLVTKFKVSEKEVIKTKKIIEEELKRWLIIPDLHMPFEGPDERFTEHADDQVRQDVEELFPDLETEFRDQRWEVIHSSSVPWVRILSSQETMDSFSPVHFDMTAINRAGFKVLRPSKPYSESKRCSYNEEFRINQTTRMMNWGQAAAQ